MPVFFLASVLSLSACSFGGEGNTSSTPPPPAPGEAVQTAEGLSVPTPMDTFRELAPPEGMKFQQLFAEPIGDTDTRMARLENAVQTLRNDLDTIVPPMVRLVAVEKDMKDLIGQLKVLTEGPPPAPPASYDAPESLPFPSEEAEDVGVAEDDTTDNNTQNYAPALPESVQPIPGEDVAGGIPPTDAAPTALTGSTTNSSPVTPEAASDGDMPPEGAASPISGTPAPSPAAAVSTPPAPQPSSALRGSVKEVRVGDHPDKTRIVVDLTVETPFVASLQNGGKTLVIDIQNMDWSGIGEYIANSGKLVVGYKVVGHSLMVDLLYPATISQKMLLPPNGKPYHRLFIDLHSPEAHQ